jgi:hypothetical protein
MTQNQNIDNIDNIDTALARVQGSLPRIVKAEKANTGTYGYTYAGLSDIHVVILPILSANGLAWTCTPTIRDDGRYVLVGSLRYGKTSERIECEFPLPSQARPQELGSAIAYARRYAICAVVGIAPDDEDDDGVAAQAATVAAPQRQRPAPQDHAPAVRTRRRQSTKKTTAAAQPQDDDIVKILDTALKTTDRDWHVGTWKTAPRSAPLPLSQLTDHHRRCLRAAGLDMAKSGLTVEDALTAIGLAVQSTSRTVDELIAPDPDPAVEEMDWAEAAAEGQ